MIQFDTHAAPAYRRLSTWRDIVCDVFVDLDCTSDEQDFRGSVKQALVGSIACTRVDASRQRVYRTPSRIAKAKEHFVLLALGIDGAGCVVQDGREAVVRPGEFALYDTTRPYELHFGTDFSQIILQVPRDLVLQKLGGTEAMTAATFSRQDPLQQLAYDFMAGLSRVLDVFDADTENRLACQTLELLALVVRQRFNGSATDRSSHRSALTRRLKSHIDAHLRRPDLSLENVAAALGISTRYVNVLFAAEQTSFGRYLLSERLDRCRRDLVDPRRARVQVGETAFGWGFNDLSHFSRAFKQRFGLSPREARCGQQASNPPTCNHAVRAGPS